MKKLKNGIPMFIVGFLLMAIAHITIQCESFTGNPDDGDDTIIVDETAIKNATKEIENAFISGQTSEVEKYLSPTAKEFYSDLLSASSIDNLISYGEAFKNRTLTILNEGYAEYTFSVNGVSYSVALSLIDEENWMLTRF